MTDDEQSKQEKETPETRKEACPVCHSDMHENYPQGCGEYHCVLCGYGEDENDSHYYGEAL